MRTIKSSSLLAVVLGMAMPVAVSAQGTTITGQVIDAGTQQGLAGANLVVENTPYGAGADADGVYTIDIPASMAGQDVQLTAGFIGYKSSTATITLSGGTMTQDFGLEIDPIGLEEIVAVGYGTARLEELTGSIRVIGADELEQLPTSSFQSVLAGNPGLQVTANDGAPGAGIAVRVRGIGSINASNEPLYVIDGIPVTSGSISTTDFSNGGRSSNVLASINPNDIESIVVAKDAASTAIYGSRGANGVVMINTKGGATSRAKGWTAAPKIEVRTQRGYSDFAFDNLLKGLNRDQYEQLYVEGYINSGRLTEAEAVAQYAVQFPVPANTNWLKEMTRTGITDQFDVSAQGGTDRFTYFISGGALTQEGTVQNNFFDRYSSRANLSAQLTDKLRLSNNINLSYFNQRGITDGTRWQAPFYLAYLMAPTVPIKDDEGLYYADHKSFFMGGNNPVGHLYDDKRELEQTRIIDNLFGTYQLSSSLRLSSIWSFDILNVDEYLYQNMRYGDGRRDPGNVNEGRTDVINWQGTQTVNFKETFGSLHNVDLLVGYENQKISTDVVEAFGSGFSHPDLKTLASAAVPEVAFSSRTAFAFQSYFTRINYNLANRYYVSGSYRTDGSSRFGPEQRWGNFWSFGLGYALSDEPFMQGLTFINYLKFRGSYGETGNAEIGNFPWAGLYGFNREYDGLPGAAPTQISNPLLTWESQQNLNMGFDFAVFDNKLSGTVDMFDRTSTELLLEEPLSYTTGFRDVEKNVGDMRNTGVEVLLRADLLRTAMIDLSITFNVTQLKNEITKLDEPIVDGTKRREEGRDYQEYWLYGWAGVDPANGDPLWYTDSSESATTNKIGDAERYYHGKSASPDSYGSFGLSGRVGPLSFSAQANYQFGGYVFDLPGWVIHGDGRFTPRSTSSYAFENRWTPTHTDATFPQHRWGGNQSSNNRTSTRYLFEGDYIRLKNVQVAYNLPQSITSTLGVRSLEAYVNLNNYWTWVADEFLHFDPEQAINGNYNTVTPISKVVSFGINIGL